MPNYFVLAFLRTGNEGSSTYAVVYPSPPGLARICTGARDTRRLCISREICIGLSQTKPS